MGMSSGNAKKAAFALFSLLTADDLSMTTGVRAAIAATIGGDTLPTTAGDPDWYVEQLLNDLGYGIDSTWLATRDTSTYPTEYGPTTAKRLASIMYLALHDPGSLYSGSSTVRARFWNLLSTSV